MLELLNLRGPTSKVYDIGNNKKQYHFHIGHIHYKDAIGNFQDVDYTLVDKGLYWEMARANYNIYIAKDFGSNNFVKFVNLYEGANHSIIYDPHSIWFVNAVDKTQRTQIGIAQPVTGVLNGNIIRYTNAFGVGLHFEITLRRSGFVKEIIVDSQAALGISPYLDYFVVPVFKWKVTGLIVNDGSTNWDKLSFIQKTGQFTVTDVNNFSSFIKPAYAIDSNNIPNKLPLSVFFEKRNAILWQGKLIPKSFIDNAVYPIKADTVTNYYAGSGDGDVNGPVVGSWAGTHDATSGTANNGIVNINAYSYGISGTYIVMRSFFPIDTSGIADTDTIDAATFYGYVNAVQSGDNDGDDWVNIVGPTTQDSPTTLINADVNDCGAVTNPTEGSTRRDISSQVTNNAYNTWALNATGLTWVSKTGYTLLGMREGHDCINSSIGNAHNYVQFAASETTGTSQDPYLAVTTIGAETITLDKWASNIVQLPLYIKKQQYLYQDNFNFIIYPILEVISLDKWYKEINQPIFDVKRQQYLYPNSFVETYILTQPEFISLDKWYVETNKPVFDIKRQQYLYPSSFVESYSLIIPEFITLDKWYKEVNKPVFDIKRQQYLYPYKAYDTLIYREIITLDKWAGNIIQPIFDVKRQQYLYPSIFTGLSEIITLDKWYVETNKPVFDIKRQQYLYLHKYCNNPIYLDVVNKKYSSLNSITSTWKDINSVNSTWRTTKDA